MKMIKNRAKLIEKFLLGSVSVLAIGTGISGYIGNEIAYLTLFGITLTFIVTLLIYTTRNASKI